MVKGRFSYDPQLSYGLNLKPWIIDNWVHYKIVDRPVFEFKAGAVISSFFSEYETGTVQGHFFNLQADRSDISIGERGLLSASVQLFYINYTGNSDGLFTAANISASLRKIPFSVFAQLIQAITSNISPFPEFKWNVGIVYTL